MTYKVIPNCIESSSIFGFGDALNHARKKSGRNSVSTAEPALNNHALQERDMSLIPTTPGIRPAQATPQFDYISARDDFLRREAERGSEMLLRAMIRELESMGVLA